MKKICLFFVGLFGFGAVAAQVPYDTVTVVDPQNFTLATTIDTALVQVISRKAGLNRRINFQTVKSYSTPDITLAWLGIDIEDTTGIATTYRDFFVSDNEGEVWFVDNAGRARKLYDPAQFQDLTISDDTIYISDGNFAILPGIASSQIDSISYYGDTLRIYEGGDTIPFVAQILGGLSDGDYGHIDVSGSGTVMTVDTAVIGPTQIASTAVTPGSYTNTSLTVDADGRITAASNGAAIDSSIYKLLPLQDVSIDPNNFDLQIGTNADNNTGEFEFYALNDAGRDVTIYAGSPDSSSVVSGDVFTMDAFISSFGAEDGIIGVNYDFLGTTYNTAIFGDSSYIGPYPGTDLTLFVAGLPAAPSTSNKVALLQDATSKVVYQISLDSLGGSGSALDSAAVKNDSLLFFQAGDTLQVLTGIDGNFQTRFDTITKMFQPWNNGAVVWDWPGSGKTTRDPSNVISWGGKYYFYGSWFPYGTPALDSSEAIVCFESSLPFGPYAIVDTVLTVGAGGTYDDDAIFTPNVVVREDSVYIFYSANDGDGFWNIGCAVSDSPTGTFAKKTNPVFLNGTEASSTTWDGYRVDEVEVIRINRDTWRMYYKGVEVVGTSFLRRKIGFAETSADNFPVGWTRYASNPIADSTDMSNSRQPESIAVWRQNSNYWMGVAPQGYGIEDFLVSRDGIDWQYVNTIDSTFLNTNGWFHGTSKIMHGDGIMGLIYHYHDSYVDDDVDGIKMAINNSFVSGPVQSLAELWSEDANGVSYTAGEVGIGLESENDQIVKIGVNGSNNSILLQKDYTGSPNNLVSRYGKTGGALPQLNDIAFKISVRGRDVANTSWDDMAEIQIVADGTFGANDTPGRIDFLTSPDGTGGPLKRWSISNEGYLELDNASFTNPNSALGNIVGRLEYQNATTGGLKFLGFNSSDTQNAFRIAGYQSNANPTAAAISLRGFDYGGGTAAALATTERVIDVYNNTTEVFAITGDGAINRGAGIGSGSATPDGSGDITITHGMGTTPAYVVCTVTGTTPYVLTVHTKGATTFKVRVFDMAGAAVTTGTITFDWIAEY